jgi:hypothetical protein
MESVAYWHPTDGPDSEDTLVYILKHRSRQAAVVSWRAFLSDPEWREVAKESQKDGKFLRQRPDSIYMNLTDYSPVAKLPDSGWTLSYKAGYKDGRGVYAGGSEIMHLQSHKGKLYAFNGYWCDTHYPRTLSAQVLRLDAPDAEWQVDLNTHDSGKSHMKGNILKSVKFRTDHEGSPIDETVLIAGSQADVGGGLRAVSVFTRNDRTGKWDHDIIQRRPGGGVRRVPRDIELYRDTVTNVDRVFMLIGDPGILSGVLNSTTGRIEWDDRPEHPTDGKFFPARPLGITEANGSLYFSVGGKIFKRLNGRKPRWELAYEIKGGVNTDVGGIRGLSTIDNPNGPGESLIFVWTPRGSCVGDIKRLDGPGLAETTETTLRALFGREKINGDAYARFSLGGYNRFAPVKRPGTGELVHIVGYEQRIVTANESLKWNHYYKGAMYSVRTRDQKYTTHEVNGRWQQGKQILVAPRAFANSPFDGEEDVMYFAGHDANFSPSTDMAWIYKAPLDVVLGLKD